MSSAASALWTPLDIGPMRVKHRVMVSGHALLYGVEGVLSDRHVDYYRERAAGGAALLVTEQQAAHPSGVNYLQGCRAYDPRSVAAYRKATDAVHAHGAKLMVQLFCGGAQGSGTMYIDEWRPLWAPSPVASTQFHEQPAEMTRADVAAVIAGFEASARHAAEGGMDGIEIHAAHSQLLGAFLSPAFNHRSDGYGGSTAARCRIVREIGERVRAAVGGRLAVGLRLSVDEKLANGAGIREDEFLRQLEILDASGLFDFYDLSIGGYFAKHFAVTPMTSDLPPGFLAPAAARARSAVRSAARILMVGRVLDLETASRVVESGAADMVAMTRAHIADPYLVKKSLEGRSREVLRCVGANVCIRRLGENNHVVCLANPAVGRERALGEGTLKRAAKRKRIAVAGAGPAGLRLAGTAAARGLDVTLFEAQSRPGGRLLALSALPGRERWATAIENLMKPLEAHGVTLRLGEKASRESLGELEVDLAIVATGARFERAGYSAYRPERAGIPGAEAAHVMGIDEAIECAQRDPALFGPSVVIVDDGFEDLAAGLAERLATAGAASVRIVSPRPWWGESLYRTYDMSYVMPRLRTAGVVIEAQTFVEAIAPGSATLYDVWNAGEQRTVQAHSVVLALGRTPAGAEDYGSGLEQRRIGDCLAPRSIEAVIYEGEEVARTL
jgi:2,4-dienoyl-CoA reductase-like NADH-dependent reductase (Old Yellow Enzyme family)